MRRKEAVVKYAGFTIRKRVYASGEAAWQLDVPLGERGNRERKTYATLVKAKAAADDKANELLNRGASAFTLTDYQRLDAVEALGLLKNAAPLADAARCWLRYHHQADQGQTFDALVKAYRADMEKRELRPATLADARKRLTKMAADMGKLPAVRIASVDLENWLDAQDAKGQNRRNHITVVRGLFNWAVERGELPDNPADKVTMPKVSKELPAIFSLATVAKIMHAAESVAPDCVGYLALCFFAGLRPMNEAGRATWEAIDFENDTVRVIPEVAKTRRARLVTIAPNLRDWLQRYRLANRGGQIAPAYGTLVKRMRAIKKKAGVTTWPEDVARHCFASAHLALHGDIQKTCLELGHASPQMLFSHYRNVMSATQAAHYFAIRPGGKIPAVEEPSAHAIRGA
jgi:integrase